MSDPSPLRKITATDLIGLRIPAEPSISPDGRRVAFALSEVDWVKGEERYQVHLGKLDAGGGEAATRQLTFGLSDAAAPAWSPDGRHLAFVTFRAQPHEEEEDDAREDGGEKRQVFVMPADGGEARRLTETPEGVELFRWSPDGSGVITLGQAARPPAEAGWARRRRDGHDDPFVTYQTIPTWEIWYQPLEEGEPKRLLAGVRGVDEFDVSPDGRWLAYTTNHTGRPEDFDRSEIVLLDLDSGKSRAVSGGRGGCESGPRFTEDGRFLLFWGWASPTLSFSRQELFAVDLTAAEGSVRPLLEGIDRDLEEFLPLPDGRVAALVAWGMESRLLRIEPATGAVEVLFPSGAYLGGLSVARKAGILAMVAEDAASCPEIAVMDPAGGLPEKRTNLNPHSRQWRRARRERLSWENEGFRHEGLVLLPEGGDGPPPVLVWIHGGPHWRVVDTLRVQEAEALAARGWAVFLPQFRGSSGGSQEYALASRGDLGGADARDVLAGLDHLAGQGWVDGSRAAVGGASYGGYLVNWLLATTDRFRTGISVAGIFDLAQDYATSSYSSWEEHYLGGRPWEKPDLYRERSPLFRADQITAPVLILHGWEDDNTFFTNGKALHRSLTALGRESELVLYPREGHGLSEPHHRHDAATRIGEWLERHVRGGTAPHVAGKVIEHDPVRLLPLGVHVRRDYAGVRPPEGRVFLEIGLQIAAREGGPEFLRLVPSGSSADVVLIDQQGGIIRPIGVPLEVHGQSVLFWGRGAMEAWVGEEGQPPVLPVNVVFEVPAELHEYQLRVSDLPPVLIEVRADEEETGPAEGGAAGLHKFG